VTEEQWLTCNDLIPMLEFLRTRMPSDRKFRLFAVACYRRWPGSRAEVYRGIADVAERLADGQADYADLRGPFVQALDANDGQTNAATAVVGMQDFRAAVWTASEVMATTDPAALAELLRCIFGPYRPVRVTWRTPAMVELAREIYERRRYDLMPALGAALSDAGCSETSVLEHCARQDHVKGCFLVDMLLGKY
jgi:hypothetical protein